MRRREKDNLQKYDYLMQSFYSAHGVDYTKIPPLVAKARQMSTSMSTSSFSSFGGSGLGCAEMPRASFEDVGR